MWRDFTRSRSLDVSAGLTIHQEGAENGLDGYSATGLWHVTATRASE
jgi:hypothetical protein